MKKVIEATDYTPALRFQKDMFTMGTTGVKLNSIYTLEDHFGIFIEYSIMNGLTLKDTEVYELHEIMELPFETIRNRSASNYSSNFFARNIKMLFLVCYLVDSDILNKITKNQQSYKFMHSTFSDRIFCYLKTEKQWNKGENDRVYNIEIQIIDKTLIIS